MDFLKFKNNFLIFRNVTGFSHFHQDCKIESKIEINVNQLLSEDYLQTRGEPGLDRKSIAKYLKILNKLYGKKWHDSTSLLINIELIKDEAIKESVDFNKCTMSVYRCILPKYGLRIEGKPQASYLKKIQEDIYEIFLRAIERAYDLDAKLRTYNPPSLYKIKFDDREYYRNFLSCLRDAIQDYDENAFGEKSIMALNNASSYLKQIHPSEYLKFMSDFFRGLIRNLSSENLIAKCSHCGILSGYFNKKKYCTAACRQKAYYARHPELKRKSKNRMKDLRALYKEHGIK